MRVRSHNPALAGDAFRDAVGWQDQSATMTVEGTCVKTGILLVLAFLSAAISWRLLMNGDQLAMPLLIGGGIVALITCFVTCFKPQWAGVTGPVYAIAKGLTLGGVSALYNNVIGYQGIVFQAACLTFGTMFGMLIAYQSGWIRVTEKFKAGLMMAIFAVFFVYVVNIVMGFFGAKIPYLHEANPIGIGISAVIVVIASLTLLLDFDFIDRGSQMGAPKYMEWYGAFGLMVTLAWLYIEMLRLLYLIYAATRD